MRGKNGSGVMVADVRGRERYGGVCGGDVVNLWTFQRKSCVSGSYLAYWAEESFLVQFWCPMSSKILKLTVSNFRGIENLTWLPSSGVNLILGGGDTGKTTILEAINLLFSPATSISVSETDYWMRNLATGFSIECIMQLDTDIDINTQSNMAFPWHWNESDAAIPTVDNEISDNIEVYKFRFSANEQQEAIWEIIQPNEDPMRFSVGLRRQIGLISLPSDDRNDKDLRLVYGSALDRLIGDPALRSRVGSKVAALDLHGELSADGKRALDDLDLKFGEQALPTGLSMGLTSSQGVSIGSLIGLLAQKSADVHLPFSAWGAGTRRLASLEIGSANKSVPSLTTIDEVERGLEPYRLRQLITKLSQQQNQIFVTTHSPITVSSAIDANLWYLDSNGKIGELKRDLVKIQQKNDPETFLARVAVIAEGPTEVGFMKHLLQKALGRNPLDHGIRVCNGQGNDNTCNLLKALTKSGLKFAGVADNEGRSAGSWAEIKAGLGDFILQWDEGCTEQVVISAIPDSAIPKLIGSSGDLPFGTRMQHLKIRSGAAETNLESITSALAVSGKSLKQLVIEAASGSTLGSPDGEEKAWKSHGTSWFKSEIGGKSLAQKLIDLGGWEALSPRLFPLISAILGAVDLTVVDDFPNV